MYRNTFFILISFAVIFAVMFGSACQSVEKTNANAVNKSVAADATNAPPGFSGKMTNELSADPNAPRPTVLPKGTTPTPGIPSEEELKKQMTAQPKKTPPIPGIPSEEELKKQMNTPISNAKIRETKPPIVVSNSNVQSPTERPRKVRKP